MKDFRTSLESLVLPRRFTGKKKAKVKVAAVEVLGPLPVYLLRPAAQILTVAALVPVPVLPIHRIRKQVSSYSPSRKQNRAN